MRRFFWHKGLKVFFPFSPLETTAKAKANLRSPQQYLTGDSIRGLCRSGLFDEFAHFESTLHRNEFHF